jgi:hypothetical protein
MLTFADVGAREEEEQELTEEEAQQQRLLQQRQQQEARCSAVLETMASECEWPAAMEKAAVSTQTGMEEERLLPSPTSTTASRRLCQYLCVCTSKRK